MRSRRPTMSPPDPAHLTAFAAGVRGLLYAGPLLPALVEQSGRACGRLASAARLEFAEAATHCGDLFAEALDVNPHVGECFVRAFVAGYDEGRPEGCEN